jgi:hypothetical protein
MAREVAQPQRSFDLCAWQMLIRVDLGADCDADRRGEARRLIIVLLRCSQLIGRTGP